MPINWVPIQAGNQFQGQMGGGGGGGHVTGPLQDQGSAIEWARIQQRNAEMSQHGAVTARDAWMAQQQEEGEQRRAERDVEIYGARLSMQEEMEMNRRRNALSAIDNHPGLAPEDRNNLRTQILTGLNPLEARAQRMRAAQQQQELRRVTYINDLAMGNQQRNGMAQAGGAQDRQAVLYDMNMMGSVQAQMVADDPTLANNPNLPNLVRAEVSRQGGARQGYWDFHGNFNETFTGAPASRSGGGQGGGAGGGQMSADREIRMANEHMDEYDKNFAQHQQNIPGYAQMTPEQQRVAQSQGRVAHATRRRDELRQVFGQNQEATRPDRPARTPSDLSTDSRRLYDDFQSAQALARQNQNAFPRDAQELHSIADQLQNMLMARSQRPRSGPPAERFNELANRMTQLVDAMSGRRGNESTSAGASRAPTPQRGFWEEAGRGAGMIGNAIVNAGGAFGPIAGPGTAVGNMLGR